ncbi:MAG: hypothetical protein ISR48_01330 [Alphaproteobacteria bacterium]|nr:hypothetical protein [Alphaproteobacteria bacterium]
MEWGHGEQGIENAGKIPAFAQEAAVVFSGRADLWWLKFLKPGFRHCFLVLRAGGHWVVMDPLAHRTEIQVPPVDREFDLCRWLEAQGFTVVRTRVSPMDGEGSARPAPWMPFSCVEAIKRVLGIRSRRVVTPWSLYCYLTARVGEAKTTHQTGKIRKDEFFP